MTVRRATDDDATALSTVLAEAFLPGPIGDWLIPNLTHRRTIYHRYFALMLHRGLHHGHVATTTDLSAVAIWYDRTQPPPPSSSDYDLAQTTGIYAHRFSLLDATFEAAHPHEAHHYLAFVAVDPTRQGHGIGSALLAAYHTTLDRTNTPAYLEASNERNRNLYLRLGYTLRIPIVLPGDGPTLWPMWRPPTPSQQAGI
ncbi:GNAT family N-acetyltransferase [Micromonospora sp. DT44]